MSRDDWKKCENCRHWGRLTTDATGINTDDEGFCYHVKGLSFYTQKDRRCAEWKQ